MNKSQILVMDRGSEDGIWTADRYLSNLRACVSGDGPCDVSLLGAMGIDDWNQLLKDAEGRLTYTAKDLKIGDMARGGAALTKGSILDFDAIITTTRKDRDGDVLETAGATIDPNCPLLLFHNLDMPVGKMVAKTLHTKSVMAGRFCIFDTTLGKDAAILVEGGALRISHGFDPEEFEPSHEKDGRWHITKLHVMEVSLVAVPSNTDAVITAFSREKLHSPLMKSWGERLFNSRPVQGKGVSCTCSSNKEKQMAIKGDGTNTIPSHLDDDARHNPRGQGPQQGDGDFALDHNADLVEDESLPGVDDFDVQNKVDVGRAGDGPGQNPAPNTALSKAKPKVAVDEMEEQTEGTESVEDDEDAEEARPKSLAKAGRTISANTAGKLQEVHDHLDHVENMGAPHCSPMAKCHITAAKGHVASMLKDYGDMASSASKTPAAEKGKTSSMNPNGSEMPGVPADDKLGPQEQNSFDGTPKPNSGSPQTQGSFDGTPSPKPSKHDSRIDPGTTSNESVDAVGIPGSLKQAAARILMDADELDTETAMMLRDTIDFMLKSRDEEENQLNMLLDSVMSE